MPRKVRLGILTPSSNTSLEPLTQAIIACLPNVSVHFSRFRVLKISLDKDGLNQFQNENIVAAAQLLADAEVDVIGWSGTSSGWLGFEADEKLCADITAATGIPATTSVLALNKAAQEFGVKELGLVTPYTDDVQEAIIRTYSTIDEPTLDGMVGEVAGKGVQAITTFCTNLRAAQRVAYWEKEYNVPVFDTVATVIWEMLRMCEVEMSPLQGWGMLFTKP
uniref:Asp glu racemase n=1 Tax=Colletotrichum fructicola (strain Nara gc5) TaxID=1213859 RepID=L2FU89_COLFN